MKKALEGAKKHLAAAWTRMSFSLQQPEPVHRGSEHLAKICKSMGVDLGEIDKSQQAPLFAVSRGTTTMVRFC